MNWVFWTLILIALIILWLSISGKFLFFGDFLSKIFEDTVNIMNEEDKKNNE